MDILKYEKYYTNQGYSNIAGIDEAGRGPLAGPVVAAAVIWGDKPLIEGIKDSKKISEKKRFSLYKEIMTNAKDVGIGIVQENKIDEINILQSTFLAMRKAIGNLSKTPDLILVDGNKADIKHIKQKNIIKGDSLSYTIGCASIIAKVTRDKIMIEYHNIFPEYNFHKHKGYGTKFHLEMIEKYKTTPIHRKSFKPISSFLPTIKDFDTDEKLQYLSAQICSVHYVKKTCKIIDLNNYYDLLAVARKKIFICSINTIINGKTINSKIPLNRVNFKSEIKKLNSLLELSSFSQIITHNVSVLLKKDGSKILINEGTKYDI